MMKTEYFILKIKDYTHSWQVCESKAAKNELYREEQYH
jgi:hypothetical protein